MFQTDELNFKLANALLKDWNYESQRRETFLSTTIPIENLSLVDLATNLSDEANPIFYYKTKDSETEYLSIGAHKVFKRREEFPELIYYLQQNENLIVVGGQKFFPLKETSTEWQDFGPHHYILPKLHIVKKEEQSFLYIHYPISYCKDKTKQDNFLKSVESLMKPVLKEDKLDYSFSLKQIPDIKTWNDVVSLGIKEIKSKKFQKFVQARKELYAFKKMVPKSSLDSLLKVKNNSYSCFLKINSDSSFYSVTPERLFSLNKRNIQIDSIAGTRARGKTEKIDFALEEELKSSEKEVLEHELVSKDIDHLLGKVCSHHLRTSQREILKLKNVQHLHSKFAGELKSEYNALDLITLLHPTPAVCGFPKKDSSEFLIENEGFDRGFYAAPFGILSKDFSEFCVAIRSALSYKNQLHIYGGAGIVKDSNPQDEWEEIKHKLGNFHDILND